MKFTICLSISILAIFHSIAQSGEPVSMASLPIATIRLGTPETIAPSARNNFSRFEVIDIRPDTARIGVHTILPLTYLDHPRDKQLVFHQPAAREVAGFLNTWCKRPDAAYTALIVLRALWLSDATYEAADVEKDPKKRLDRTHIRIKAEIYAVRDGHYIPLLRFDTLQATRKGAYYADLGVPYEQWGNKLAAILIQLADSCSAIAAGKDDPRRYITLDDILHFNASRFDTPIGSDKPARGVYANFEEFRNNKPSITDVDVRMEKNQRFLYIRESGNTYYSRDAWGYCDGKNLFVMRDGILCPAWREGKAIYFYSDVRDDIAPSHNNVYQNYDPSDPFHTAETPTATTNYNQRYIYSVDMDTGGIY